MLDIDIGHSGNTQTCVWWSRNAALAYRWCHQLDQVDDRSVLYAPAWVVLVVLATSCRITLWQFEVRRCCHISEHFSVSLDVGRGPGCVCHAAGNGHCAVVKRHTLLQALNIAGDSFCFGERARLSRCFVVVEEAFLLHVEHCRSSVTLYGASRVVRQSATHLHVTSHSHLKYVTVYFLCTSRRMVLAHAAEVEPEAGVE